jgi:hypothetical protein
MKNILIILLPTLLFSCTLKTQDNSIAKNTNEDIKTAFANWTKSEIEKGTFFAKDSCNWDYYIIKDSLGLEALEGFSIPEDSSEIGIYYAHLNHDDKEDALITFTPTQCDGGNGSRWAQYQLLVLSQGNEYIVNDNYFNQFDPSPGFFLLDSAATRMVCGTYLDFVENDGLCCPSIKRRIKINLDKNELIYIDK